MEAPHGCRNADRGLLGSLCLSRHARVALLGPRDRPPLHAGPLFVPSDARPDRTMSARLLVADALLRLSQPDYEVRALGVTSYRSERVADIVHALEEARQELRDGAEAKLRDAITTFLSETGASVEVEGVRMFAHFEADLDALRRALL